MIKYLALGLGFIYLTSCCVSQKTAERRISRYVECNPALVVQDSVQVTDTIYTDSIQFSSDTVVSLDTTYIYRDGAKVKIVRRDTIKEEVPIYVEVECPPDTVYFDKRVPCPDRIQVTDYRVPLKDKVYWGVLGGLILLVVIVVLYFMQLK
jgi:hypothetical protein